MNIIIPHSMRNPLSEGVATPDLSGAAGTETICLANTQTIYSAIVPNSVNGKSSSGRDTSDNRPLYRMFSKVPAKYDLLNRLLTLGLDQRWRRKAAEVCLESKHDRIMDLCAGTGDLAIALAKMASGNSEIIAADFCKPMLEVAERKALNAGLDGRIAFRVADAASLPFDDGYFDVVTIAFGFRNLTFKNCKTDIYLKEIFRVITPGGRLVIVETSQQESNALKWLSRLYYMSIVKPVGNIVSGERGAYSYLSYSARNYYKPSDVRDMLTDVGFTSVDHRPLWRGIAAVHVARK
jgi:demethylmenaquinone methyltransferase/2-methoxy-6-polyprenyl-1,4-benzoquinol methylase